jgi:hypothetical protein
MIASAATATTAITISSSGSMLLRFNWHYLMYLIKQLEAEQHTPAY